MCGFYRSISAPIAPSKERRFTSAFRASFALLAGTMVIGSISAAPIVLPNVPDFFQHQGLRFNPEPYPNSWNPGTGFNWEPGGGWCRATGLADSLYSLRARGYANVLPFFNNANPWRQQMSDSVFSLRNIPAGGNPIANYLAGQGYSQYNGPNGQGLLVKQYVTDGASNTYVMSAYGRYVPTGQKALDLYAGAIARGDAINVRLGANRANVDPSVWWAGSFHYVSGVGVDVAAQEMYVADPDSNKGSLKANAGWATPPFPNQNDPKIKARVYGAADPFPVGPANPAAAGFADYYGTFNVGAGNASAVILGNDGGDNRYRNAVITGFETITPVRVGRARRAPRDALAGLNSAGPGTSVGDITVNFEDDLGSGDYIDKILILPVDASPDAGFDNTISDSNDTWVDTYLPPNFIDPLGEPRSFGGVEYDVLSDGDASVDGLNANESDVLTVGTTLDFTRFDVLFHDGMTGEWMIDPIGAPEELLGDQVPEPSALVLLGISAISLLGYRKAKSRG